MTAARKPLGQITWIDDSGNKHWADFYAADAESWGAVNGFPFEIAFNRTSELRFAKILKTVVHVAMDEDDSGNPISATWKVKTTFYNQ